MLYVRLVALAVSLAVASAVNIEKTDTDHISQLKIMDVEYVEEIEGVVKMLLEAQPNAELEISEIPDDGTVTFQDQADYADYNNQLAAATAADASIPSQLSPENLIEYQEWNEALDREQTQEAAAQQSKDALFGQSGDVDSVKPVKVVSPLKSKTAAKAADITTFDLLGELLGGAVDAEHGQLETAAAATATDDQDFFASFASPQSHHKSIPLTDTISKLEKAIAAKSALAGTEDEVEVLENSLHYLKSISGAAQTQTANVKTQAATEQAESSAFAWETTNTGDAATGNSNAKAKPQEKTAVKPTEESLFSWNSEIAAKAKPQKTKVVETADDSLFNWDSDANEATAVKAKPQETPAVKPTEESIFGWSGETSEATAAKAKPQETKVAEPAEDSLFNWGFDANEATATEVKQPAVVKTPTPVEVAQEPTTDIKPKKLKKKKKPVAVETGVSAPAEETFGFDTDATQVVESIQSPAVEKVKVPSVETVKVPSIETVKVPSIETVKVPSVETVKVPSVEIVNSPAVETVKVGDYFEDSVKAPVDTVVEAPKTPVVDDAPASSNQEQTSLKKEPTYWEKIKSALGRKKRQLKKQLKK